VQVIPQVDGLSQTFYWSVLKSSDGISRKCLTMSDIGKLLEESWTDFSGSFYLCIWLNGDATGRSDIKLFQWHRREVGGRAVFPAT